MAKKEEETNYFLVPATFTLTLGLDQLGSQSGIKRMRKKTFYIWLYKEKKKRWRKKKKKITLFLFKELYLLKSKFMI